MLLGLICRVVDFFVSLTEARKAAFILVFASLLLFSEASGQCYVKIPSESLFVESSLMSSSGSKDFWLCKDASLKFSKGSSTFYIEAGGSLVVADGPCTIYMKKGASVEIRTDKVVSINHEPFPDIRIRTDEPNVQKQQCDELFFNYSEVESEAVCAGESILSGQAQKNVSITENTNVITPATTSIGASKNFWVCANAKFGHSGTPGTFYVEKDGFLHIRSGGGNIVYLKQGAKLKLGAGGGNVIFHEANVNIEQLGNNGDELNQVESIVYDLSRAPENNCFTPEQSTSVIASTTSTTAKTGERTYEESTASPPMPARNKNVEGAVSTSATTATSNTVSPAVIRDTVYVTKVDTVFVKEFVYVYDTVYVDRASKDIASLTLGDLQVGSTIRLKNVLFDQGKHLLKLESYAELNHVVELLKRQPDLVIQLEGHTDNQGNAKLNLELSKKRVETAKAYIVQQGIDESRILTEAFGGLRPIARNNTETTRKLNRRVEMKIVGN